MMVRKKELLAEQKVDRPAGRGAEGGRCALAGKFRCPRTAQVQFDGDDPDAGRILKYVCVTADDDH